jgi:hypothetical protein
VNPKVIITIVRVIQILMRLVPILVMVPVMMMLPALGLLRMVVTPIMGEAWTTSYKY